MIDRGMLAGLPQTIGQTLDFKKWLNLTNGTGAELLTGGAFTGSATGWTLAAGWTYGSNAVAKDGDGTGTLAEDAFAAVVGDVYLLSYVISGWSVGTVTPSVGGASGAAVGANGTYRVFLRATTTAGLSFAPTNTARFTIDTISLKKIAAQVADQVAIWIEDQGGTAGKATLYIRGENGTVVGIGGDGFTFGDNDEDVTLLYAANTLTLAGGVLLVPDGAVGAPSVAGANYATTGMYWATGPVLNFAQNGGLRWQIGSTGNWLPGLDDTYNVGTTNLRVAEVYATLVNIAGSTTEYVRLSNEGAVAGVLQQGVDAAVPVAQIYKGPDGSGTDKAGGDLTRGAGRSTGTGAPGTIYDATSTTGTASNATQQALVNRVKTTESGTEFLRDNLQSTKIANLTELTTIAAAATTDTTIQIPANVIVLGVSVRVTTVIPTAATFTVIGTTTSTAFQTGASVSTAANTTDVGTKSCPYLNTTAQTIRITPNLTPADDTGRVRVTIHYILITAPAS